MITSDLIIKAKSKYLDLCKKANLTCEQISELEKTIVINAAVLGLKNIFIYIKNDKSTPSEKKAKFQEEFQEIIQHPETFGDEKNLQAILNNFFTNYLNNDVVKTIFQKAVLKEYSLTNAQIMQEI